MPTDAKQLQATWDELGEADPLWAVMSSPDKKGNKWKEKEFFAEGRAEVRRAIKALETHAPSVGRERVLDFGCGVGRLSRALATEFKEVVGVDIAPSMLKLAKRYRRKNENIRYVLNERTDLRQFPSETFDFIYTHIVLQHMQPKYARRYLAEFARLLKPGGAVLFQIPSHTVVQSTGWRAVIKQLIPPRMREGIESRRRSLAPGEIELYGIRRPQVEKLLTRRGLTVVDVEPYQVSGAEWVSYRYVALKQSR
jgi:SAM-dependent methyltransferase